MDYCVPRADQLPPMSASFDEIVPCKTNLLGVKGCGELGTIGAVPAVVHAVLDALGHSRPGHAAHPGKGLAPRCMALALSGDAGYAMRVARSTARAALRIPAGAGGRSAPIPIVALSGPTAAPAALAPRRPPAKPVRRNERVPPVPEASRRAATDPRTTSALAPIRQGSSPRRALPYDVSTGSGWKPGSEGEVVVAPGV